MAITFTPISTTTVGAGGTSAIDFSNIPLIYTDLLLKMSLRTSAGARDRYVALQINNNSSPFAYRAFRALNSGTIQSAQDTSNFQTFTNGTDFSTNTFGTADIYIGRYASTNHKTFSIDGSQERQSSDMWMNLVTSYYQSIIPINKISVRPDTGNFVQYSTVTLYGIKNA